jgi:hypothetical protein
MINEPNKNFKTCGSEGTIKKIRAKHGDSCL